MTEQHIGPGGPTDEQIQAQGDAQERPQEATSPSPALPAAEPLKAPEIAAEPLEEWNPLASLEETRVPVPSSGGRAFVIVRPWSGRERLAYEDELLVSFLVDNDAGEATARMGQMRLVATSLTVRGSDGFPVRGDGSAMFTGDDRRRVREELLSLDPKVYEEIKAIAVSVQPLPTARLVDDDDEPDAGDGEEGGDPFPTPSTPATAAPLSASE